jgi:hypothetical protein
MTQDNTHSRRFAEALLPKSFAAAMVMLVAAGSAAMNGLTALGLYGPLAAAVLTAGDLFKPTLLPAIRADFENRAFGKALAALVALAGLVAFSAFAGYNTLLQEAQSKASGPDRQAAAWHEARLRLEAARTGADAITARRAAEIEPLIGPNSVGDKIWNRTGGCLDVTRDDSKAACGVITGLREELARAREKERLTAIIAREEAILAKIGAPVDTAPGITGIAQLTGFSRDQVRFGLLAFGGLLIELISTFGLLLVTKSRPKPLAADEPPASVLDLLRRKADDNGNAFVSYRTLALELGWTGKGKVPLAAKVKRQIESHAAAGLLTFTPTPRGTQIRLLEIAR